jgi:hypothetical protein
MFNLTCNEIFSTVGLVRLHQSREGLEGFKSPPSHF